MADTEETRSIESTSQESEDTPEELEHACQNLLRLLDPNTFPTIEILVRLGEETRLSTEKANHSSTRVKLEGELEKERAVHEKAQEKANKKYKEAEGERIRLDKLLGETNTKYDKAKRERTRLEQLLGETNTKYDKAERERTRLEQSLGEMNTKYKESEKERARLEKELQDEKIKLEEAKVVQSKNVTDMINSLLKGNGRFNDGYPQESESGRTELDENYLLKTDGTVVKKKT